MKPLYDGEVDQDDQLLQQAIQDGIVPPKCQLGGAIVQGISVAGGDPCGTCSIDREFCGGRPKSPGTPPSHPLGVDAESRARMSLNDGTMARQHQRKLTIMQLNKMMKEKKSD